MKANTESVRNIVVSGHSGTGKTTFFEHLLARGGLIPKPETVESGKTVSDYSEEEIGRKISIHAALGHLTWQEIKLNLFDTPGSMDFMGEVIASLSASESALIMVDADVGVQIGTIQIWRRLEREKMPRMIFINKMEKEHADFDKVLKDLGERFDANFVPLAIPIGAGGGFKGIVDLFEQKAYLHGEQQGEIPPELQELFQKARQALVEAAAEGDDALMEKFFEEEGLSDQEIQLGLSKALSSAQVVPVLCGAALLDSGLTTCLNTLATVAPAPGGEGRATDGQGQEVNIPLDPEASPSCQVFRTSIDQFAGKLSFVKVMTGSIRPDSELVNLRQGRKEKIAKLYTAVGKKLEEVELLQAGDVGILAKLDSVMTNDTLAASSREAVFLPLQLPKPVHSVAIHASSRKDEDKLNQLLQRAAEEDLTFQIAYNKETKQTVISGMGELHLNIILQKIRDQQKIEMQTTLPRVAYRETLRKPADAEYQHKKQTGGHGQYAKVVLEFRPLPRGENFSFVNGIVGGRISKGYIPGVEKGVVEGMEAGILAGYPVVDLEAKVVDGKEHSVDSSEMAFKLAARGALKAALEKADPVLLEPVMNLNVFVEDQYLGDVLSDLSSRRGKVLGQEPLGGGIQEVKAQVPQAELLRYSLDLKSITSGTATFEMEFANYEPITGKIAEEVIKAAARKEEGSK